MGTTRDISAGNAEPTRLRTRRVRRRAIATGDIRRRAADRGHHLPRLGRIPRGREAPQRGSILPPPPSSRRVRGSHRLWMFLRRPQLTRYHGTPDIEIAHEGQEIVVLAEVIGVRAAHIRVAVHGNLLLIETRPIAPRRYRREVALPFAVSPVLYRSYGHGVLEIQMRGASPRRDEPRR